MIGIHFSYLKVPESEPHRHAQKVMSDLGISYTDSEPNSMADSWRFFGVDPATVPSDLPPYLTVFEVEPHEERARWNEKLEFDRAHRKLVRDTFFSEVKE